MANKKRVVKSPEDPGGDNRRGLWWALAKLPLTGISLPGGHARVPRAAGTSRTGKGPHLNVVWSGREYISLKL